MLFEPARSPYDWHFQIAGFPVRVTWLFWVISAAYGYDWARGLDEFYVRRGLETPGMFVLLAIWIGVSLVSILIHEMGHGLAMRWYGQSSYIVLYHFGGLAIPDNFSNWRGAYRHPLSQIVISAAGPLLQLAFGIAIAFGAMAAGLSIGSIGYLIGDWIPVPAGEPATNAALMGLIDASVLTSVFWAVINLVPVLPLDGGRIAQSLLAMYLGRDGTREATILSIVASAAVALWAFQIQHSPLGVNFMVLGIINYQSLNDPFSMR